MRHRTSLLGAVLAAAALLAAGCAAEVSDGLPLAEDQPQILPADNGDAPIPVEPDGGIGDQPIPVEGDGGIGGDPGDGSVTSNLILAGDQVQVLDTCVEPDDSQGTSYRLELDGGAMLWLHRTGDGDRLELRTDGATATSPDAEPPVIQSSDTAISAQGDVVAADGTTSFVDVVIGTADLALCGPA